MSRIGNNPISVPEGVNIEIHEGSIKVSGKLGSSTQDFDGVSVSKVEDQLLVKRNSESKDHKAKHGLYRSLFSNMVIGVSQGWTKSLELVGVGYRAQSSGQKLDLSLGFSHNIVFLGQTSIRYMKLSTRTNFTFLEVHNQNLEFIFKNGYWLFKMQEKIHFYIRFTLTCCYRR